MSRCMNCAVLLSIDESCICWKCEERGIHKACIPISKVKELIEEYEEKLNEIWNDEKLDTDKLLMANYTDIGIFVTDLKNLTNEAEGG